MRFEEFLPFIFAGENPRQDYNMLWNSSNLKDGPFSGTNVSEMTLNDLLDFSNVKGPYAKYVQKTNPDKDPKTGLGVIGTPMGMYQIVGNTLKSAMEGLKLDGTEIFTPELQDKIGRYIFRTQGPNAWPGALKAMRNQGNGVGPPLTAFDVPLSERTFTAKPSSQRSNKMQQQGFLQGLLGGGQPRTMEDEQARLRRIQFANAMNPLIMPEARTDFSGALEGQQKIIDRNRTKEVLQQRADAGDELAAMVLAALPVIGASNAMQAYLQGSVNNASNKTAASTKFYPASGITANVFQDGTIVVKTADNKVLEGEKAKQAIKDASELEAKSAQDMEFDKQSVIIQANLLKDTMASLQNTDSTIKNLTIAKNALNRALSNNSNISGPIAQYLPNISVAAQELSYARQALGLDIIGSVTFGALSKGELDLALAQGLPTNLNERQLLEYVTRREYAMRKMKAELAKAARHLAKRGNTIETYLETFEPVIETSFVNMPNNDLAEEYKKVKAGTSTLPPGKRQEIIDETNMRAGF